MLYGHVLAFRWRGIQMLGGIFVGQSFFQVC